MSHLKDKVEAYIRSYERACEARDETAVDILEEEILNHLWAVAGSHPMVVGTTIVWQDAGADLAIWTLERSLKDEWTFNYYEQCMKTAVRLE